MKNNIIGMVLSAALATCVIAADESLQSVLDQLKGPTRGDLFHDEHVMEAWPGLGDPNALDELLRFIFADGKDRVDRSNAYRLLKAMKLPKEEIVTKVLEMSAERDSPDTGLGRVFSILANFMEDPRVWAYFVNHLDDKRLLERREAIPSEEHFYPPIRVCDSATGAIRQELLRRALVPDDSPAMGRPGGEFSHKELDLNIPLLKAELTKLGLMPPAKSGNRVHERQGDEGRSPSEIRARTAEPTTDLVGPYPMERMTLYGLLAASCAVLVALGCWLRVRFWKCSGK